MINDHIEKNLLEDISSNGENYYIIPAHLYSCIFLPVSKENTDKKEANEIAEVAGERVKELEGKIQALTESFCKEFGFIQMVQGVFVAGCSADMLQKQVDTMGAAFQVVSDGDVKKMGLISKGLDLLELVLNGIKNKKKG